MEVIPGKPKDNIKKILEMVKNAKQEKVDLIAFPEMSVGGYLLGDKWLNDEFCTDLMSYNEDIRKASEGIAIWNEYLAQEEVRLNPPTDGAPPPEPPVPIF